MSFDIHLVPLELPDQEWDGVAVSRILEARRSKTSPGQLRTADGGADLYGEVTPGGWLMVNHVEGFEAWSVIHEIAEAGPYAVMPVDCPTFAARLAHGDAVPDELPRPVVVVAGGEELRSAIVAGADGVLPRRPSADALAMFRSFLDRYGTSPESLTVSNAVLAMTSWYLLQRVEGADLDNDGDMLLFQWGTYDWGTGPRFEYNLTRQFVNEEQGEVDPEICQLLLTVHFPPSAGEGLGSGQRWCHRPDELADFQRFVMATESTRALATEPAHEVVMEFEPVD